MAKEYQKKYSPEIHRLLKGLCNDVRLEDKPVRERQIRTWRRLKMLWENFQSTYYNEVAHDWSNLNAIGGTLSEGDQAYYDKPMNVFRAYLESIIAALSITIPGIKCYPDDAQNALDILTAKAGDQASKLIYRHNDVSILWLHALFVYCTEGLVFGYNYPESKEEYGQYSTKEYKSRVEKHISLTCPSCGETIDDLTIDNEQELGPEHFSQEPEECPNCGQLVMPQVMEHLVEFQELDKEVNKNKTHQCINAYGGLNVKVANWARSQSETPYLDYQYETHYSNALEEYPHLYGEIDKGTIDPYEVWGRLSPQYQGDYPPNNVTMRSVWLRPAYFNTLCEDDQKLLRKQFPKGVRVDYVNETLVGCEQSCLDDYWTLTKNPMSDYVHADPIGLLLVSVQEITNDLISLTLQTIEHGIGQTFADPTVLDFNGYKQMETTPGNIYPATPKAGKTLGEGFHEIKTATLSGEVMPFGQEIQQLGQTVSGALPSLFGGAMQEQKTASGYAMSRAQALQRLQNTWKMFTIWWKTIFSKAIPKYLDCIEDDERDVQLDSAGNFVNVLIRVSELSGKIGRFELESNENLPMTWQQRKDVVMQLLTMNSPEVLQILWSPENRNLLKEAVGLDEFIVPGEDSRIKQFEEIRLLLDSEPIVDPMGVNAMGMPEEQELPSVDVDPDLDDHQIEFEICTNWIRSEAGQLSKVQNPMGFRNVCLHAKQHLMYIQMAQMAQMQQEESGDKKGVVPGEKQKEDQSAPIKEEADAQTI